MAVNNRKTSIFAKYAAREVQTMDIFLTAKAARTAITIDEYIKTRLVQGADPDLLEAELIKDLEEGGRIFGEFRNAIRATSNGIINRTRDNAIFSTTGVDIKYKWVAVLVNTCPDCLDRHNRSLSWDEWEAEGLPRTGVTVCKENCRCMLVPDDVTDIEPINRKRP